MPGDIATTLFLGAFIALAWWLLDKFGRFD